MLLNGRFKENEGISLVVSSGSPDDHPLFRFIAGKLSLNSDSRKLPVVTVSNRPKPVYRVSPKLPVGQSQILKTDGLQSSRWRP